jgi:hypothetical protein
MLRLNYLPVSLLRGNMEVLLPRGQQITIMLAFIPM